VARSTAYNQAKKLNEQLTLKPQVLKSLKSAMDTLTVDQSNNKGVDTPFESKLMQMKD
jgi:hypothetical protein